MPPYSLRDEYRPRTDPMESVAQMIHLLCINFERRRAFDLPSYETHIADIVKKLELVRDRKIGLIEK